MSKRGLIVFEESSELGNAQAHSLLGFIHSKKNSDEPACDVSDYTVSVDDANVLVCGSLLRIVDGLWKLIALKDITMGGYINNDEEILLQKMVDTIVSEVAPEAIILFGSREFTRQIRRDVFRLALCGSRNK